MSTITINVTSTPHEPFNNPSGAYTLRITGANNNEFATGLAAMLIALDPERNGYAQALMPGSAACDAIVSDVEVKLRDLQKTPTQHTSASPPRGSREEIDLAHSLIMSEQVCVHAPALYAVAIECLFSYLKPE